MASLGDLHAFCHYLVNKYGDPGGLSEEQKADEFRNMYVPQSRLTIKEIRALALCCDIKVDALDNMPSNLRGFHEVYGEKRNIYYKHDDAVSGIENTILHEIREIVEPHFVEVCTHIIRWITTPSISLPTGLPQPSCCLRKASPTGCTRQGWTCLS